MPAAVHIFVLNHNGRGLLEQCLPSVLACARQAVRPCRVTVIDNGSTDESVGWLRRHAPEVQVLRLPNRGLVSFNEAVGRVSEPVVLLLNNDVRLAAGCVDELAAAFDRHPDCFLAAPLCWDFHGRYEGCRSALRFRYGLMGTELVGPPDDGQREPCYTIGAGAVLAVQRDKFLALGGFDPLYRPGRYEDLDLAYRGWLAGWTAWFVPSAVAWHRGAATFGPRFGDRLAELDQRNALLFVWKNVRDGRLLALHFGYLAGRLLWSLVGCRAPFGRAFCRALGRVGELSRGRQAEGQPRHRTDQQLLRMLAPPQAQGLAAPQALPSGEEAERSKQRSVQAPSTGARGSQKRLAALVWLAALCVLALLALPMAARRVYVQKDLGSYHLPLRHFYAQALAAGDDFTWCPQLFCGYYLHGEGQVGMYHPLHLLLYRWLPLDVAFNLELLAGYPFMLAGMWLLLRRWHLPSAAAAFGAATFTLCGFNLLHFVHPNAIQVLSHLPWLLLCCDVMVRGSDGASDLGSSCGRPWPATVSGAALGLVLLTASQLLLGYPQYVWLCGLAELSYAVFLAGRRRAVRPLAVMGLAKALGVLVAAVQLVPTWELLAHSARANVSDAFRGGGSLHPANFIQLVAPYFLKHRVFSAVGYQGWQTQEYGLYMGAACPALLVWLAMGRRWGGRFRHLLLFAGLLAALGALLALGRFLPAHGFISRLPLLNLFRCPCRYALLLSLGLAVAMAVAFAELSGWGQRADSRPGRCGRRAVLLAVCLSLIAAKVWAQVDGDSVFRRHIGSTAGVLVSVLLLAAAFRLVSSAAAGRRAALYALVAFACADQAAYGLSFLWAEWPDSPTTIGSFLADARLPAQAERTRLVGPNRLIMRGGRLANGYVGLPPARQLDYSQPQSLRLAGVGWIWQKGGLEPVPEPLPRVWLAGVPRSQTAASGWPQAFEDRPDGEPRAVTAGHAEPTATLSVSGLAERKAGCRLPAPGSAFSAPQASIIEERNDRLVVRTGSDRPRLLVLADSLYPGWQVTIDGAPARLLRPYGHFRGCLVPASEHEVVFLWRPASLRLGKACSAVGLALLGLWAAVWAGRRTYSRLGSRPDRLANASRPAGR